MSSEPSVSCSKAVERLRALMEAENLEAFVIPSTDAHMSEYTAARDNRRTYVSNFTGSAGTALVTRSRALLWTDGRYYLQATKEMFPGWELMRATDAGVPTPEAWCAKNLPEGSRVGFDPEVTSCSTVRQYVAAFAGNGDKDSSDGSGKRPRDGTCVVAARQLVDEVWNGQPAAPSSQAMVQGVELSGQDVAGKLAAVRAEMTEAGAACLVVCALDEIMWLLNIRGADVPYNPVLFSYCLVTAEACTLFADAAKLGTEVTDHLAASGVTVLPYDSVFEALKSHRPSRGARAWIDPARSNAALWLRSAESATDGSGCPDVSTLESCFVLRPTPIHKAKGVKNPVEIKGAEDAHRRDAVALCTFFAWLERAVAGDTASLDPAPPATLDEVTAMDVLDAMRAKGDKFVSLSFSNICGADANGAIIHYRAEPGKCSKITRDTMLLVDSGGQYRDGTTDVTRTVHLGTPTKRHIEAYTRVLRGHIALADQKFPTGTKGTSLDVLARAPLWEAGWDYRHGTGHGVGSFLNVHEGPHAVTFRKVPDESPLSPGMLVTDEPGYYEDGSFGVRIENVMVVEPVTLANDFGGVGYLGMRALTLVPLEPKLIDTAAISPAERRWINEYHALVRREVGPLIGDAPITKAWFDRCTKEI